MGNSPTNGGALAGGALTLTMPCPACSRSAAPGTVRDARGQVQLCPNCQGATTVPLAVRRQPFDYAFPIVATPQSSPYTVNANLQLDNDAYFELMAWTLDGGGNGLALQLVNASNGWGFSNAPIDQFNFSQEASNPFSLLVPMLFPPGVELVMTLSYASAPSALVTPQVTMKGFKLYPLGRQKQKAAA
jgi:hypothetical protein